MLKKEVEAELLELGSKSVSSENNVKKGKNIGHKLYKASEAL
ncbi:MAG: hypothetical protein ACTSQJ_16970 [Promethearchaeota archaeon]